MMSLLISKKLIGAILLLVVVAELAGAKTRGRIDYERPDSADTNDGSEILFGHADWIDEEREKFIDYGHPVKVDDDPRRRIGYERPNSVDSYQDPSKRQLDGHVSSRSELPMPGIDYSRSPYRVVQDVDGNVSSPFSWAYAAVAAIEGKQHLAHENRAIHLSADMLIKCYNEHHADHSKIPLWPFEYVFKNGLAPKSSWRGDCTSYNDDASMKGIQIFTKVLNRKDSDFPSAKELLFKLFTGGPFMVGLDKKTLSEADGKVPFDCKESADVNHYVLLMGYDKDNFMIKNFWGKGWGKNGYGLIKRQGNCNPFAQVVL